MTQILLSLEIRITPPGTGAVPGDLETFIGRLPLFVESFRDPAFVGTASNPVDLQTLQAAFAAWVARGGGEIHLDPNRIYDAGIHGTDGVEIPIITAAVGIPSGRICGNNALIAVTTVSNVRPNLFTFYDSEDVVIQDLRVTDLGYDPSVEWRGINAFVLDGDGGEVRNFTFDNVHVNGAVSFFTGQGREVGAQRVDGVHFNANCVAENCYYSVSCQENGDNVTGSITAINPLRAYFAYGVAGHDMEIRVFHDGTTNAGATSCGLIKRYTRDTKNLRIKMSFAGALVWDDLVRLEHHNDAGAASLIDDIDVDVHVEQGTDDPGNARSLVFSSYTADAPGLPGVPETGSIAKKWTRIRLRVAPPSGTGAIVYSAVTSTTRCVVTLDPDSQVPIDRIIAPNFAFRIAHGREFYVKHGSLIAAAMAEIDLAPLNGRAIDLKIRATCYGSTADTTPRDTTIETN